MASIAKDLTGRRFGKLTAIELAEPVITQNGVKRTTWRCKCDCGNECIVRTSYLTRGVTKYCGKCEPPDWLKAKYRKCRTCEFSEWDDELKDWQCSKGQDTSTVTKKCGDYWCGGVDKLTGVKNREGTCLVCGKPVYSHGRDVPIYCYEHREYAKRDQDIIDNAPKELLFGLIAGIFFRAKEDYIYNTEGQRSDAEVFLRGRWAQELSHSGFDAERVLELLNEEIKNEL